MMACFDNKAQVAVSSPEPLHTRRASADSYLDPIDDFFGHTLRRQSSHLTHSRPLSANSDILPAYHYHSSSEYLPEYSLKAEPVTLVMYLFKFGFLFPPFWVLGTFILLSPLRAPNVSSSAVWMPEKTEGERQMLIKYLRKAELKWARRCLYALVAFVVVAVAFGVVVWWRLRN